jgi:hypothetical protein
MADKAVLRKKAIYDSMNCIRLALALRRTAGEITRGGRGKREWPREERKLGGGAKMRRPHVTHMLVGNHLLPSSLMVSCCMYGH